LKHRLAYSPVREKIAAGHPSVVATAYAHICVFVFEFIGRFVSDGDIGKREDQKKQDHHKTWYQVGNS